MQSLALKYRIYPTKEQKTLFAQTFGCVRFVYNNLLDFKHKQYYQNNNSIDYKQTSQRLTELKKKFEWLNDVSSVATQQSLRNLDAAYKNFFQRRGNYPKFKSRNNKQSFRLVNSGFRFKGGKLYVAKNGSPLKFKLSRPIDLDKINSITITKDCANRYFVSIQGEKEIVKLPLNDNKIGIDLGINSLLIDSNGKKYSNLKLTKKYQEVLKKYQRRLSTKKKGSSNRNKARVKVARVHAKIADVRRDHLHKISTKLIQENQLICIEDLNVKGMVQNPKLAKSISDCGWGELISMLEYKAKWHDRTIVKIDRWYPSSKTCSSCGHLHTKMPLHVRTFSCESCGVKHDRDINAAKNVLAVGTTVLACGDTAVGA